MTFFLCSGRYIAEGSQSAAATALKGPDFLGLDLWSVGYR
jgi:hypothetical protein